MMIDSHAHAHFHAYKDDMDEVIKRSLEKGTIINLVGTQKDTSRKAVEVAEKYDGVYASIGLHPEHLFSKFVDEDEHPFMSREENFDIEFYKKLAAHPKVIGIGETGLDVYRLPENITREELLKKETEIHLQHIAIAKEFKLPLVVHCRDAHDEQIKILSNVILSERLSALGGKDPSKLSVRDSSALPQNDNRLTGVIHCYTSDWEHARKYLDLGFYIGFTGIVTFPPLRKDPKAQHDLWETVKNMPEDRILLETDCPYLSPIPYRGKRGEPWMIEATAAKIAELRGKTVAEVLDFTTRNAKRLFAKIV